MLRYSIFRKEENLCRLPPIFYGDNRCELKEATLYSAFRRLEQAGYIRTYWGDETVGARRRYYSITEEGRRAYQVYKRDWEEAKADIDRLLK